MLQEQINGIFRQLQIVFVLNQEEFTTILYGQRLQIPGAQVNFTMGNYSYSEYNAIRPATLTTQWQKFSMQFTVTDNQVVIRGPIHFSYASNVGNTIYIDNLQIAENEPADTGTVWKGPALATGASKFLGNAYGDVPDNIFANYWTQLTPGNAGKWGTIAGSQDTTQWNWSELDGEYNYAISNHLVFKDHNLIWGHQQPSWISSLDSATQAQVHRNMDSERRTTISKN